MTGALAYVPGGIVSPSQAIYHQQEVRSRGEANP